MPNKTIIVTGAGFSVPAQLPMQNQILHEMTKDIIAPNFLSSSPQCESVKFLKAYIKVGLFLLQNYTSCDSRALFSNYYDIEESYSGSINIMKTMSKYQPLFNDFRQLDEDIKRKIDYIFDSLKANIGTYPYQLSSIKERIRKALIDSRIDINLEDVFTSFDISINSHEHSSFLTYSEMDDVKNSIMRLFVFYLGNCLKNHSFDVDSYHRVTEKIRDTNDCITVITTNWDTLLEKYLSKNSVTYDLCLNSPYFINDTKKVSRGRKIQIIKIHGSINWYRCIHCGSLTLINKDVYAQYLFNDLSTEKCPRCKHETVAPSILMQPEIITPTMKKTIDTQLYRNLWNAAKYELMSANRIIFIGYSLPMADYEFRYLLQKNVPTRANIHVVLHPNDNPNNIDTRYTSLLPEKRYRNLFSRNEISFFYNGFGDYFNRYSL